MLLPLWHPVHRQQAQQAQVQPYRRAQQAVMQQPTGTQSAKHCRSAAPRYGRSTMTAPAAMIQSSEWRKYFAMVNESMTSVALR